MDNRSNSRANTCCKPDFMGRLYLLDPKPIASAIVTNHNNLSDRVLLDGSFKFLPYQLSMVVYWTTMAITGNGELGFDSGEGAWETATTSKEGSRRVNYPILIQGGSDKKSQPGDYVFWDCNENNLTDLNEEQLEGKSGASSRGNSSSNSVY